MTTTITDLSSFLQDLSNNLDLPEFTEKDNFTITGFNTEILGQLLIVNLNKENGIKIKSVAIYSSESQRWEALVVENIPRKKKIELVKELIASGKSQSFIAEFLNMSQSIIHRYKCGS